MWPRGNGALSDRPFDAPVHSPSLSAALAARKKTPCCVRLQWGSRQSFFKHQMHRSKENMLPAQFRLWILNSAHRYHLPEKLTEPVSSTWDISLEALTALCLATARQFLHQHGDPGEWSATDFSTECVEHAGVLGARRGVSYSAIFLAFQSRAFKVFGIEGPCYWLALSQHSDWGF